MINFVYHTVNGEEKEEMPKWIGVQNIVQALKNISEPLDVIETNYDVLLIILQQQPSTTKVIKVIILLLVTTLVLMLMQDTMD